MHSLLPKTHNYYNRSNFSFALVIEEAAGFRRSVIALLRKRGWLVHGISRAEETFSILAHIPYTLIVVDSELPGICGMDFVRILQNSREWRTIRLVIITSSNSVSFASQVADSGAFLARRSKWLDDLFEFFAVQKAEFSDKECLHSNVSVLFTPSGGWEQDLRGMEGSRK